MKRRLSVLVSSLAVVGAALWLTGSGATTAGSSTPFDEEYGNMTGSELADYLNLTPGPPDGCNRYAGSPVGDFCLDGVVSDSIEFYEVWQRLGGNIPTDLELADHAAFLAAGSTGETGIETQDPVMVWYTDTDGVCLNSASTSETWCSGPPGSQAGIWYDEVDGLCFSVNTDPAMYWCSGATHESPVLVWSSKEEGVCFSVATDPPKSWCSGGTVNDPQPEPPLGVWVSEADGLCFSVATEPPTTWCSGAISG